MDPFAEVRLDHAPPGSRALEWVLRHRGRLIGAMAALAAVAWLLAGAIGAAAVALLALPLLIAVPCSTSGPSMLPALAERTWGLLLLSPPFPVRRGDPCVVRVDGLRPLVRRLAAVEGDRVALHDGRVWVDDALQPLAADLTQLEPERVVGSEVLPGTAVVLGDHVSSIDSRHLGAVPRTAVAGRYVPLVNGRRRGTPAPLSDADHDDLDRLRELAPPALPTIEAVLDCGGASANDVWLLLRWAWRQVGDPGRLQALLDRARRGSWSSPVDRAFWTAQLAVERARAGDPAGALEVLDEERQLGASTPHTALLRGLRASMLARSGRYDEALQACDDLPPAPFCGPRISALVGLRRLDEARAHIDAVRDWGPPFWEPWYRACLAVAEGELEAGAALIRRALDAGFPDRALVATTPHLERLRASAHWDRSWSHDRPAARPRAPAHPASSGT